MKCNATIQIAAFLVGAVVFLGLSASANAQKEVRVYVHPVASESLSETQRGELTALVEQAVVEQFNNVGWSATAVKEEGAGVGSFNVKIGKIEPVIIGTLTQREGTVRGQRHCKCKHSDTKKMVALARATVDHALQLLAAKTSPSHLTIECQTKGVRMLAEGLGELHCGKQGVPAGSYRVQAFAEGHHPSTFLVDVALGASEVLFARLRVRRESQTLRYTSYAMGGVGVGLAGIGLFNMLTHSDDVDGDDREKENSDRRFRGQLALGVGGALAVGGLVLYFVKVRKGGEKRAWTPALVEGSPGVAWLGEF